MSSTTKGSRIAIAAGALAVFLAIVAIEEWPAAWHRKTAARSDTDGTVHDWSKPADCTVLPSHAKTPLNNYDGQDVRGGMDCKFPLNGELPPLTLHIAGTPGNTLGDIEVVRSGKPIQTIHRDVDLSGLSRASLNLAVQSVDANFDGYQDLQLLTDCGQVGSCRSEFYLYDPAKDCFVFNKVLSELGNPEFDPERKQVKTFSSSSNVDSRASTYEFHDGAFVLVKYRETDAKEIRTYALRNGKMALVDTQKQDAQ